MDRLRAAGESTLDPDQMPWIEHGNNIGLSAPGVLHIHIKFNPMKTAMSGVGVDANHGSLEPASGVPGGRVQMHPNAIADGRPARIVRHGSPSRASLATLPTDERILR